MDMLKKILSPGHDQDDQVMYAGGDPNSGLIAGQGSHFSHDTSNPRPLPSGETAHDEAGQQTKPGKDNYDAVRSDKSDVADSATSSTYSTQLSTQDSTSAIPAAASIAARDARNDPTRDTYGSGTTDPARREPDATSASSVKSGIVGRRPDRATDDNPQGAHTSTTGTNTATPVAGQNTQVQDLASKKPYESTYPAQATRPEESQFGRDVALGGAAGLSAAGLASRDKKQHAVGHDVSSQPTAPSQHTSSSQASGQGDITNGTYTYRSFPLPSHDHKGHPHDFSGGSCPPGDDAGRSDYPSESRGSHAVDTANRSDPHIPGEFPSDDGRDPHSHSGRDAALTGAGVGAGGIGAYEAKKHHDQAQQPSGLVSTTPAVHSSSTAPSNVPTSFAQPPQTEKSHIGPDAACAGAGAGAAGLAGREYEKHHDQKSNPGFAEPTDYSSLISQPSATFDQHRSAQPEQQHHYGRDAAYGAGAGAAGLGGHEHEKYNTQPSTQSTTAPTSTSGQPASAGQKSRGFFAGPTGTATLQDQPSGTTHQHRSIPLEEQRAEPPSHHGYNAGRDATTFGGAGALAGGAYEPDKHRGHGADQTGPASSSTIGPHSTKAANVADPRVQPDQTTADSLSSDIANKADPRVDSDASRQDPLLRQSHLGRDAGIAGGSALAGGAAYEAYKHEHDKNYTGPASKTVGPHKSNLANILDPRVQPEPEMQREKTTAGPHSSNIANTVDPRVKQGQATDPQPTDKNHHYGRDAALVGGTGAAGAGLYEDDKNRHGQSTVPDARDQNNVGSQYSAPTQISGSHHSGGYGSGQYSTVPSQHDTSQPEGQDHYGDDATYAGAGVGAAGLAGHVDKYSEQRAEPPSTTHQGSAIQPSTIATQPTSSTAQAQVEQPKDKHHYGRDAAGAGGAGAGAYELSKYEEEKRQKVLEKDAKQKKQDEKEEKAAKKDLDKIEEYQKDEEKKHHGLLGFLHRKKDKDDGTTDEAAKDHSYKPEAGAATAGAGAGAGAAAEVHHHNKLHKDPPPKVQRQLDILDG